MTITKDTSKGIDSTFKLRKKQVRSFSEDLFYGDQYDSLATTYSTDRYHCLADMWLDDPVNQKIFHLSSGTNNNYLMQINGRKNFFEVKEYQTLDETGIFKDYFKEIESMANRELKRLYDVLNDTKNYKERKGAGIRNDLRYIFIETYNFTVPELCEYYLFEYIGDKSILSVYRNSEFMRCYLDADTYKKIYGSNQNVLLARYYSIKEFESLDIHSKDKNLILFRKRMFQNLQTKADALVNDLKNHKLFVRHLDNIYDSPDFVCQYFGVEKDFQCSLIGEYEDIMCAGLEEIKYDTSLIGPVTISLNDMYRAFELGFNNIEEICRVKHKLGSIENILF